MKRRSHYTIRTVTVILLLFLLFSIINPWCIGTDGRARNAGEWDQFRGDDGNSGTSLEVGYPTDEMVWKFETGGGVESSPAVASGKVFFGSKDGSVYCLDAVTGVERWVFPTDRAISSSPLVVEGKVYIGSGDKKLYCINAEYGMEQWNFTTGGGIVSSPKLYNEKLYFGSNDGNVYCIHVENGTEVWNYSISDVRTDVWSTPAFKDNLLYIGDSSGKIVCLDTETGEFIYDIPTEGDIYSTVCMTGDDILFTSGIGRTLYRYNGKTGQKVWEFGMPTDVYTSVCVYGGKVFLSDYEHIYCLPLDDPDGADSNGMITPGEIIWKVEAANFEGGSSPQQVSDRILIGMGRFMYCLFADNGTMDWKFEVSGYIVSSPVYVDDLLYFTSNDGYIYCLKGVGTDGSGDDDVNGSGEDGGTELYPGLTIPIGIFVVLDLVLLAVILTVLKKRRSGMHDD